MNEAQGPDVSSEIVNRVRSEREAARSSEAAWEAYVESLIPGPEMDIAALLSVSGEYAIGNDGDRTAFYAAPVSTDFGEALWLARCAEVTVTIAYRPRIMLTDAPNEIRVEVSSDDGAGHLYEGEGVHRPSDAYRDPEDLHRAAHDPDDEDAGAYHACGKPRCMADAVTRALMMMFSPTEAELGGEEAR